MKALNAWGWVLLASSILLFCGGMISGEFNGHGIGRMSNFALILTLLAMICLLLAVTVWLIARAIKESITNKKS